MNDPGAASATDDSAQEAPQAGDPSVTDVVAESGTPSPPGRDFLAATGALWAIATAMLVAGLVTGSVRTITIASAVAASGLAPLLYWRGALVRHHTAGRPARRNPRA